MTHVSGGSDAFTATDLLEAIVKRIQESSGPTNLLVGNIPDGTFVKRNGSALIGASVGSGLNHQFIEATGPTTTTNTSSPGDLVAGLQVFPGQDGDYLTWVNMEAQNSVANKLVTVLVANSGTLVGSSERMTQVISAGGNIVLSTTAKVTITGTDSIEARWFVDAGTGTALNRSLQAIKIS